MSIKWYFPPLGGGFEEGFNDSGLSHFKANFQGHTARETIQNILDAKNDKSDEPAVAEFTLLKCPTKDALPNTDEFKSIIDENVESNTVTASADGRRFFKRASKFLNNKQQLILKISDYNTKGVTGINNDESRWHNLIKKKGSSTPQGNVGGTFGIGKHAPFGCSAFRTIFYYTQNEEGESGYIWKSILTTHGNPKKQAGGYFCDTKESGKEIETLGITDADSSFKPSFINRTTVGTDVCILGYEEPQSGEPWNVILAREIMENYFIAIYENKLQIRFIDEINDRQHELNSVNIKGEMEKQYIRGHIYNYPLLDTYIDSENHHSFEKDINHIGSCKLYVKIDNNYDKNIGYLRKPQMLVFKKKNRTLSQGYAAIFTCDDKKGNGELAKMENPKHDEWEKGWHPDAEKAASIKRSISLFINEKLRSLISETFRNESVIDGLEQLLGYTPDEIEDQKESGDEEEQFDLEQYQSNWEPIEYVPPKPEKKKPRKRKVKGDRGSGDDEGLGSGGPGDSQGGGGDTPGSEGFGDMDGGSKGDSKYKKLNDSQYSYRCFNDKSSNCFKLVISTKNTKTCNISFFSRGLDTDKNDVIQLESAVDSKSGESFKISSNTIANVETTIDPKIIDVEFADHKRYAVNIEIYG